MYFDDEYDDEWDYLEPSTRINRSCDCSACRESAWEDYLGEEDYEYLYEDWEQESLLNRQVMLENLYPVSNAPRNVSGLREAIITPKITCQIGRRRETVHDRRIPYREKRRQRNRHQESREQFLQSLSDALAPERLIVRSLKDIALALEAEYEDFLEYAREAEYADYLREEEDRTAREDSFQMACLWSYWAEIERRETSTLTWYVKGEVDAALAADDQQELCDCWDCVMCREMDGDTSF